MPTTARKITILLFGATAALWLAFGSYLAATAHAATLYENNDVSETYQYDGQNGLTLTGTATGVEGWVYCTVQDTITTDCTVGGSSISLHDNDLGITRSKWCVSSNTVVPATTWTNVPFRTLQSGSGGLSNVTEVAYNLGSDISANCSFGRSSGDVYQGVSFNNPPKDIAFRICDGTGCAAPPAPPVISGVDVVEDYNSAAISWDTDDAATSEIFWGLTVSYDHNVTDTDLVTAHELGAHTLATGTVYHYKICSTNGADEETCTSDATFTTLGDAVLDAFASQVYDPPPDRIFGPGIIDNYTFRAVFAVDANVYPDETIVYDYELSDDTPSVIYDSPAIPVLTAGHFLCGQPGDCTVTYYAAHFTIPYLTAPGNLPPGDYTIRVRGKTLGGTYGDYSDPVTFTVQDVGCTDADGFIPQALCRIGSIDLIYPSAASGAYFDDAITSFGTTGAAGFFGDVADVADGDTVICPLPTYTASKFGYAGSLTMPTYDLCEEADEIADTLNAYEGYQDALSAVIAVLGVIIGVAFFKKFVEG